MLSSHFLFSMTAFPTPLVVLQSKNIRTSLTLEGTLIHLGVWTQVSQKELSCRQEARDAFLTQDYKNRRVIKSVSCQLASTVQSP